MFGVGDSLDKYLLTDVLGTGGMGTVFAAENKIIGKKVAIKILRSELMEREDTLQRFLQEARLAAAIEHPGVVEVLDFGYDQRSDKLSPYLVMEMLRGESLADILERHPQGMASELAIDVVEQVLGVLTAVHANQIIHRDLKPENIFQANEADGGQRIKLLDFGICKVMTEVDGGLTQTGTVLGTPFFMSPEQARGAKDIDHRVDLWATGAILYEMLTGQVPFSGDSYNEILAKILNKDFTRPRAINESIPEWLEGIVLKAMTWDRDERYLSAEAFLSDLKGREEPERTTDPDGFAPTGTPSMGLNAPATLVDRDALSTNEPAAMNTPPTLQPGTSPAPALAAPTTTPNGYAPTRVTPPAGMDSMEMATGQLPAQGHPTGSQTVDSLEPVVRDGEAQAGSAAGSKVLLLAGVAAVLVVVAGVGVGVLVFGGGDPTPVVEAPPMSPLPLHAPPPTAPMPAVAPPADAAATQVPAKAPTVAPEADAGPTATLPPLTEEEVTQGMGALSATVRRCLNAPTAPTAVKVAVTIGADGSTTYRNSDPAPSDSVNRCLRAATEQGRFRPAGGSRDVTFPYKASRRTQGTRRNKSRGTSERAKRLKNNPFGR